MDESEMLAERYIRSLGYTSVVYEPDGNIPPDFLIDGQIAVEVRRLNQNFKLPAGHSEGLEELAIPLWQKIKKLLLSLGPAKNGESWFIGFDFRRPLEPWQSLEAAIRNELQAFMNAPTRSKSTLTITENFQLDIFPAGHAHATFYLLGSGSDSDSGGFVLAEVRKNLELCIAEKDQKVAPFRSKYPEWWLILADHIGYGVDSEDNALFAEALAFPHSWQKIVLLDPRNHKRAFEI